MGVSTPLARVRASRALRIRLVSIRDIPLEAAAYWIGALTEVQVSLAIAAIASNHHYMSRGKAKVPTHQPPTPVYFESPEETNIPSG